MSAKRIFILNGHPGAVSLSRSLAEIYARAARAAGHEVRVVHLSELEFDADFGQGSFQDPKPLEPVLENVMRDLSWSNHFVLAMPMWWGGLPAKLKGLIDRSFLPGTTFDTRATTRLGMPSPLLTGRSARVIVTSDTPGWFQRLIYRNALIHQLRGQVLGFVGIRPARFTWFSGASHPAEGLVDRWARTVEGLGARAC
ncbi:NAD(P)H-dependent oxidoreductase [Defluviimonas salinarum]|uniref:NAD(P)H-dependent oxidoreductase n=1 Tax=Defluviimonas salinarum TaxID=2992147 RepID=A0ABT3J4P3_9RHOB|nr:NAD(P)H-dependent oxidoreductase [Defluviimonas salinarum]MCW3782652.1 NAD(P)H-dependent oxidoreductase [Defluviimonas salinarum]